MLYKPAIPTIVNIVLVKSEAVPKMEATRSYLNNPTESQFRAPMMTSTNATLSKGVLIAISPFLDSFRQISLSEIMLEYIIIKVRIFYSITNIQF